MNFKIKLNKTEDAVIVSQFATKYDADIDIKSSNNHYTVDAKSVIGIFSLDLSNEVIVSTEDIEVGESLKNDIAEYVVE